MAESVEKPKEALVQCELDGTEHPYEIVTHLRNKHQISVSEYLEKFPGAPVVHEEVLETFRQGVLYLDPDGNPWRLVSDFDKLGFQAYGPVVPSPNTPVLDPHWQYDPETAKLLYYAFEANQRPLLVGPPGSGKTAFAQNLCASLGWGFRRVNFNGLATPRTLFGSARADVGGKTYFQYGAVPLAMMGTDGLGECLLLDEISFIDPDMSAGLHEVMEPGGNLTLLENGGEIIRPGPHFRIVGTDNVGMQGDVTGEFHGTKPLNSAFMDRWTMQINIKYMDAKTEARVLMNKLPGLPKAVAELMCDFAKACRDKVGDEKILSAVTFRQLYDWGKIALSHRSLKKGWTLAIFNKASEEDGIAMKAVMNHSWPDVLK